MLQKLPNPYINAVAAALYIATLVLSVGLASKLNLDIEESIVIPMIMLSLLVLSVSIMAGLFFYVPVRFLLANKREEALCFFIRTVLGFALCLVGFVIVFLILSYVRT